MNRFPILPQRLLVSLIARAYSLEFIELHDEMTDDMADAALETSKNLKGEYASSVPLSEPLLLLFGPEKLLAWLIDNLRVDWVPACRVF
jgi:hypothetical protein